MKPPRKKCAKRKNDNPSLVEDTSEKGERVIHRMYVIKCTVVTQNHIQSTKQLLKNKSISVVYLKYQNEAVLNSNKPDKNKSTFA